MAYELCHFIAEDNGVFTCVPAVKCHRWFADEEAVPAERAARELKLLDRLLAAERRIERAKLGFA